MATIVNTTPATSTDNGSGLGFVLGIILLIAFFMLVFFYGIPLLTQSFNQSVPSVQVPGKIDVNVHTPQGK